MIKFLKKIKFFILGIIRIFLTQTFFRLIKPIDNTYIFGLTDANGRELFLHNSKYLFLYLSSLNHNCYWLTSDKKLFNELQQRGYKVCKRYSLKGIYLALKSKYWFADFINIDTCISFFMTPYNKKITMWHGIPIKKIEFDSPAHPYHKLNFWQRKIYDFIIPKFDYYCANGNYDKECFITAFRTDCEKIKIIGNPRLDTLYKDIEDCDLLMEEDYINIKKFKEQNKKIFLYMPTFRTRNINIVDYIADENICSFLEKNNSVLICKLHYIDENSAKNKFSDAIYNMKSSSDVYPILKYTDFLITDYSSICFDYLLLDKPILYFPFDIKQYKEESGLYIELEKIMAGSVSFNKDDLIGAMQDVINGIDNYKEQRKMLRDKMFVYQDGKNCERVVDWIKSLNK